MEHQHSASTAVLPLSAHPVGGHTGDLETNADQPGDQIVLEEDTFIIQEDGGMIPIPAGTVATLLPDSEDEAADEDPQVLNHSESVPVKTSQAAVPDTPSDLNCQASSKLSEAEQLKTDLLVYSEIEISVTVDNSSGSNETLLTESVVCAEPAKVKAVEESSTMASEESVPNNSTVQEQLFLSQENEGVPASDLYVQEEEEVILDQSAADVSTSICELSSVENCPVLVTTKCNSEEPAQSKAIKKSAKKKSSKQSETSHLAKSDVSESPSVQTQSKCSVFNNSLLEKTTVVTVTPAVSACGRPQRSTPRRSAIDLLKGSDVKPIRRAAAEHDFDGPPSKMPKHASSKKTADTNLSAEDKNSTDATVSHRHRRKVSNATAVVDDGKILQQSKSSVTEESSCDSSGVFNLDAVENGKLKLLPSTSTLEDESAETNEVQRMDEDDLLVPKIVSENPAAKPTTVNLPTEEIASADPSRLRGHRRQKVSDALAITSTVAATEADKNLDSYEKSEILKSSKQIELDSSAQLHSKCTKTVLGGEKDEKNEENTGKTKKMVTSKNSSISCTKKATKKTDALHSNLTENFLITANDSNIVEQDTPDSNAAISSQRSLRRKTIAQADQELSKKVGTVVQEEMEGVPDNKEESKTENETEQDIADSNTPLSSQRSLRKKTTDQQSSKKIIGTVVKEEVEGVPENMEESKTENETEQDTEDSNAPLSSQRSLRRKTTDQQSSKKKVGTVVQEEVEGVPENMEESKTENETEQDTEDSNAPLSSQRSLRRKTTDQQSSKKKVGTVVQEEVEGVPENMEESKTENETEQDTADSNALLSSQRSLRKKTTDQQSSKKMVGTVFQEEVEGVPENMEESKTENGTEQDTADSNAPLSSQRSLRRKTTDQQSSKKKVRTVVQEEVEGIFENKGESDTDNSDIKEKIGNVKDSETSRLADISGLPGLPYHAFTTGGAVKNIAEVKSRIKSAKVRHHKDKLVNQIGVGRESHSDVLEISRGKLPNVESMQARIRELEAEVDKLQTTLGERKSENDGSVGKSSNCSVHTVLSQDLPLDHESALDRREEKLRQLDRELDEKRTELTIKLACIVRYERQVLEKERRLKRLEVTLNLRKQPFQSLEDSAKDTSKIKEKPLLMTGRVDLHAEEHKLELRRQELERQSTFLEDEKKKLVAKERELETREQAAVDADLMSIANVFKSNDQTVSSAMKQSNGKISVEFSDDEDDSFGIDSRRFDSALATAVGLPTPGALPGDDSFSEEDGETKPIQNSTTKKKYSDYTEDNSFGTDSSSDSSKHRSFVKRRCIETQEDDSAKQKQAL